MRRNFRTGIYIYIYIPFTATDGPVTVKYHSMSVVVQASTSSSCTMCYRYPVSLGHGANVCFHFEYILLLTRIVCMHAFLTCASTLSKKPYLRSGKRVPLLTKLSLLCFHCLFLRLIRSGSVEPVSQFFSDMSGYIPSSLRVVAFSLSSLNYFSVERY